MEGEPAFPPFKEKPHGSIISLKNFWSFEIFPLIPRAVGDYVLISAIDL